MDFQYKKENQIRRPRTPDLKKVRERSQRRVGKIFTKSEYIQMLYESEVDDWLAAASTEQYGQVVEIIRDKYGIPACFKVIYQIGDDDEENAPWGYDYIAASDVTEYTPAHQAIAGCWDYDDDYEEFEDEVDYE